MSVTDQEIRTYMAEITWLSHPLPGGLYSTMSVFDSQKIFDLPETELSQASKKESVWSLILALAYQTQNQKRERKQYAVVKFLAPDAPQEWIHEEAKFKLFEGSRLVAEGVCLHPSLFPEADKRRSLKFRIWDKVKQAWADSTAYASHCIGDLSVTLDPSRYEVSQFTGVRDQDGIEIFEHDIVQNLTAEEEYCSPALIVWSRYEDAGWCLALQRSEEVKQEFDKLGPPEIQEVLAHRVNGRIWYEEFALRYPSFGTYKVIGNIYQGIKDEFRDTGNSN